MEDECEDDLPLDSASTHRGADETPFSRALQQHVATGSFWIDAPTTYAAIV